MDPNGPGNPYSLQYSGYGYTYPGGYSPGIVTGTPADWFGPLNPMSPSAPPEVAGRIFDFPSGYNLDTTPRPYEPIQFWQLRALAESWDVLRTIIETRKDQMVRLNWNIKPRPSAAGRKRVKPDDPVINEIRDFFTMPDGEQFWDTWLREILEDLFVIDAPTLFVRRNRGGTMMGLDVLDGGAIKRVINDWGKTPQYPLPAYQQILKGLPAVNYTTRDMIYKPRNVRPHKVMGYSPVEQIVMSITIALRRETFLLQYYTEGNMPEALIGVPDTWSMNQIREFQTWFDEQLQGQTGTRRRGRFVPGGTTKNIHETKSGALTDETDEWVTRIACFAFSISPTPFVKQVNRATAESQKQQALEEGLAPIQSWVTSLINLIIWREWNRRDIEFAFETPDDVNAADQAKVLTDYVKTGIFSINQALDKLGEDAIDGGDQHLALLPTGWVPIAPTNQFGAAGGAAGAGEVNDDVKGMGTTREGAREPPDTTPPPEPAKKPKTGVGKLADIPFGKGLRKYTERRLLSAPNDRKVIVQATEQIKDVLTEILSSIGAKAREHIEASLRRLGKVSLFNGPIARKIAESVDLSGLRDVPGRIAGYLRAVAQDAADIVMSGYDAAMDLIAKVALSATAWAKARAAELVGLDYDHLGNLTPDLSAEMNIAETTVNMVERALESGIQENLTAEALAAGIETAVFGEARAALIAGAEVLRANSAGLEIGAELLGALGMTSLKRWVTMGDDRVCAAICAQNELDGFVAMNSAFTSGDRMTPGHPRCRCHIELRVAP
jgi:hypothetical protein